MSNASFDSEAFENDEEPGTSKSRMVEIKELTDSTFRLKKQKESKPFDHI